MSESAAILRYIEAALAPLVRLHGGECQIAADEEDAIGLLSLAPRSWRVVIQYDGRGEQESPLVALSPWRFVVWVQATKGLPAKPGDDVHRSRPAGAPPLLDLIDAVDGWTRALVFSPGVPGVHCPGARATGSQWVALDANGSARQHRLSFELNADLPVFPRFTPPVS